MSKECIIHEDECPGCHAEEMAARAIETATTWKDQDVQELETAVQLLRERNKNISEAYSRLRSSFQELLDLLGVRTENETCPDCDGLGQDDDLSNTGACARCGGDGVSPVLVRRNPT